MTICTPRRGPHLLGRSGQAGLEPIPGARPESPWLYEIPQTTLVDLAADLKRKLDMTTLQTIGDPEMPVNKVLILVGGGSLGLGVEEMPMQAMEQTHADVMLCGDVTEWTPVRTSGMPCSWGRTRP